MVNKIGRDYLKSEKAMEYQLRYIHNPAIHNNNHSGVNKIKGAKKAGTRALKIGKSVQENRRQSGVKTDVKSYFSKAAGLKREAPRKPAQANESSLPRFNANDRIKMSLEAKDELKIQNDDGFASFRHENPLNMTAFRENLGLPPQPAESIPKKELSLADKLSRISKKTAGMPW